MNKGTKRRAIRDRCRGAAVSFALLLLPAVAVCVFVCGSDGPRVGSAAPHSAPRHVTQKDSAGRWHWHPLLLLAGSTSLAAAAAAAATPPGFFLSPPPSPLACLVGSLLPRHGRCRRIATTEPPLPPPVALSPASSSSRSAAGVGRSGSVCPAPPLPPSISASLPPPPFHRPTHQKEPLHAAARG